MASRYNSFNSRSSISSDPSSSSDFKTLRSNLPASSGSRALVKSKPPDLARTKSNADHNLTAMVKKFMERKATSNSALRAKGSKTLLVPSDLIAEDLKKTARKGSNLGGLHKKLFGKGTEKKEAKALTEVKANTRTLGMVLRSERELLSANKDQELEIADLKMMLQERNREVEKLKDLCLQQREEIKSLKSAILFPDVMNSQLQELLEKQGSELNQARQVIPTLQRQVTSLTGQLQCLAEDIAEVKADKHPVKTSSQGYGISPRTPSFDQEEATNSLEFGSVDNTPPGSPDDMFLKDLNPCLTPYCPKSKSKEFETLGYCSPCHDVSPEKIQTCNETDFASFGSFSKSSDYCQSTNEGNTMARAARRSDERKCRYGKPMHHKLI